MGFFHMEVCLLQEKRRLSQTPPKILKTNSNKNIKYCDSYNTLSFFLPDGLHYDTVTDQKIIDFIINKCIKN